MSHAVNSTEDTSENSNSTGLFLLRFSYQSDFRQKFILGRFTDNHLKLVQSANKYIISAEK